MSIGCLVELGMTKLSFFTVPGNLNQKTGYGVASWEILKSLKHHGWETPYDDYTAPVQLSFCQPNWYKFHDNQYKIGYTPWESTVVPDFWVEEINQLDEFWTTSRWCEQVFKDNGVIIPMKVYPHGIDHAYKPFLRAGKTVKFLHCISDDTEILTIDGWRSRDKVIEGDLCASFNKNTFSLEYVPVKNKVEWHCEEDLVRIKNWNFDALVTTEHDLFIRNQGAKSWNTVKAGSLDPNNTSKRYLPSNIVHSGLDFEFVSREFLGLKPLEECHPRSKPIGDSVSLENILSLMGWYISEGSLSKKSNYTSKKTGERAKSTSFCITQKKNQQNVIEIMDLIKSFGASPSYTTGGDIVAANSDLYDIFSDCGIGFFNKRIPRWVFSLSPRLLKNLFDSMMNGDGSMKTSCGTYYTSSPQLKDDFQELCFLLGYRTSFRTRSNKPPGVINGREIVKTCLNYEINVAMNHNGSIFPPRDVSKAPYQGMVWCVSNVNGTIITRRNGKITPMGNCGEPAPRKGGDIALNAFLRAFKGNPGATLTIKAHHDSSIRVRDLYGSIIGSPDDEPNVNLITREYTVDEMIGLYMAHDVLIYPSYGEGFGLIPLQAVASGMPTIGTSGFFEFEEELITIKSRLVDSPWPFPHPGQVFQPDAEDLTLKMVEVYENIDEHRHNFFENAPLVHDKYDWNRLTGVAFEPISKKFSPPSTSNSAVLK